MWQKATMVHFTVRVYCQGTRLACKLSKLQQAPDDASNRRTRQGRPPPARRLDLGDCSVLSGTLHHWTRPATTSPESPPPPRRQWLLLLAISACVRIRSLLMMSDSGASHSAALRWHPHVDISSHGWLKSCLTDNGVLTP